MMKSRSDYPKAFAMPPNECRFLPFEHDGLKPTMKHSASNNPASRAQCHDAYATCRVGLRLTNSQINDGKVTLLLHFSELDGTKREHEAILTVG